MIWLVIFAVWLTLALGFWLWKRRSDRARDRIAA